jgi:hypothetical protein
MTNLTEAHLIRSLIDEPPPSGGRHRGRLSENIRRAWTQRNWRKLVEYGFAALLIVGGLLAPIVVGWSSAFAGDSPPAQPVAVRSIDEAEKVFLAELSFGGLDDLTLGEQDIAVEIAREHVAHGHLSGMRYRITDDFYFRIPRLTTEQRDIARICVEHHFKAVTGKSQ